MMLPQQIHALLLLLLLLPPLLVSVATARDCARSWRRAWRDLDCQEQDDFLEAISSLKANTDIYDEFVWIHDNFFRWTHNTPEFLPWHRWYIWQFEKALQEHTGRCIYLPYWDWERDSEREWEASVFEKDTFGRWDATSRGCVDEGVASRDGPFGNSWSTDGGTSCLEREFLDPGRFGFTGEAEVLSMMSNLDQYDGFREDYENGPHMLVHGLIGGHMMTNWSPADPLFWLHHANVDRMWTMWQDYWEHDDSDPDEYFAPLHYEGDLLDDELTFDVSDGEWNFQMQYEDGSWDYPTARDVMSNNGPHMRVTYMNDHLASLLDYDANPQLHRVAMDDVDILCDRESWRRRRNLEQDVSVEEILMYMPPKNSLQGEVDRNFTNEDDNNLPRYCQGSHAMFTLEADREEWKRLCRELPHDTPMAERLAMLSQNNCNRRGNPRTDEPELMSRMSMMAGMQLAAPSAYECHHRPKR